MERLCRLVVLVLAISAVGGVASTSSLAGVDQVEVYKAGDKDNTGLQYNCFRIPALISTTAGRVYAFAEGRRTGCNDHGDVRIVVRVSEDGGSTFGPIMQVVSEEGHTIGNPAPVVDSLSSPGDDIIHLIYSRDNHQVFTTSSSDSAKGTAWKASLNITASVKGNPSATSWIATGPPGGVQLPAAIGNGRLAICSNFAATDGKDYSFMIYSDDRGVTWNASTPIPLGVASLNNECQLSLGGSASGDSSGNYKMYAFIRGETTDASQSHHLLSSSTDGGLTWSPSQVAQGITGPECEGSIGRYQSPSAGVAGQWAYMTSAPASPLGRYNLTVYTPSSGQDVLGSWQPLTSLWSGPAAYSSQFVLATGLMGILYERGTVSAYESLYLALLKVE